MDNDEHEAGPQRDADSVLRLSTFLRAQSRVIMSPALLETLGAMEYRRCVRRTIAWARNALKRPFYRAPSDWELMARLHFVSLGNSVLDRFGSKVLKEDPVASSARELARSIAAGSTRRIDWTTELQLFRGADTTGAQLSDAERDRLRLLDDEEFNTALVVFLGTESATRPHANESPVSD